MYLRQSTAYTFRHGPFLDDTDGATAETGLTISQADVRISKAGGNFAQKFNSTSSAHDEIGFYIVELGTTDTNTCGELLVAVHESGALPVFKTFQVVEEAIYDSLYAASATLDTKLDAIDTVVDSILVDTAEIGTAGAGLTEAGATGNHLTAVPWNSAWDTEVQSECADALTAYDGPTKAEMDTAHGLLATEAKQDVIDANINQIETAVITNAAGVDIAADIIALKAETVLIVADTNELQSDDIPATLSTISGKVDTVDTVVDSILVDTGTTLPSTLSTISGKVDVVDGVADSILVDTAEIGTAGAGLTEAGATGDHLTAIPWNSSWDTEVQSECTDALNAYDPPTKAEMDSAHSTTDGKIDAVDNFVDTEIAAIKTDTAAILVDTNELQTDDIPGTLSTISGKIDTVDNFLDTEVAAILADTNELQGDWVNGGRLDLLVDSIITKVETVDDLLDTEVAAIKTDTAAILVDTGTTIPGTLSTIDTVVDSILADTSELQLDDIPGSLSTISGKIDTVDGIVDSILVDTAVIGAAGAGLTDLGGMSTGMKAEVNAEADTALSDYDAPTKSEMDTAHGLLATEAKQDVNDANIDLILADTNELQGDDIPGSLSTISGKIDTVDDLLDTEVAAIKTDTAAILVDTNELQGDDVPGLIAALNDISTAQVNTEVDTALADYDGPTKAEMDTAHALLATEAKQDIIDTNIDQIETAVITNATGVDIAADIIALKAQTVAIEADTNELQGDDIPASLSTISGKVDVVDGVADAILVDTGTTLPATLSTIDSEIGTVDTVVDAIKVATDKMVFTTSNQLDVQVITMATDSLTATAAAADFIGSAEIAASASGEIADLIAADWIAGDGSPLAIVAAIKADAEWSNLATIDSNVDAILADTADIQPNYATSSALATVDSNVDLILVDTGTTLDGKINTIDTNVDAILVDSGTTLPSTLSSILTDTAEIGTAGAGLTEAGGTGDQLTAVGWNSAWDAEVQSECTDALNAYDPPTKAEIDSVHSTTDALITTVDGVVDSILTKLPNIPTKGVAIDDFPFFMVDITDHVSPKTGLTSITAQRSVDGAAFGSCSNSPSEIASGVYKIDLSAADLNGDTITLRFSKSGEADDRVIVMVTQTT